MKNLIISGICFSVMFLATSCGKDVIRGEGQTITQQRTPGSFHSVHGNADIKLHISYGSTGSTEVRGYSNLVNITETEVVNGVLKVNYKDDYSNIKNSNVEVYIVMPVLNGVSTNGSGDAWIDGFTTGNDFEARINGSSNVSVSNSNYDDVLLDINGSGDMRMAGLNCRTADATIHGSGDIEISCSQNLKARIYGSGDIRYWGNPTLDVEVSGSGRISRQ